VASVSGTTAGLTVLSAGAHYTFTVKARDAAGNLSPASNAVDVNTNSAAVGVVSTLAGKAGVSGSADGTGADARFSGSQGFAADGAGNLYVADTQNSVIRKVTPTGVVSTLAGKAGTFGSADGTGTSASFNGPWGVAVDGVGNVYVADTNNNTIRKVTPAGVVSTLAGTAGTLGSADGTGAAARFNWPWGIAVDAGGNVYVADYQNGTIRRVTTAGVVSTFAGKAGAYGSADGAGANARFSGPTGIAVDGAGNVWVGDSADTIRKVTPAGVVSTLAGTAAVSGSADGTGAAAAFDLPDGVAVDGAGNVYVGDYFNNTIRMITPAGVVSTLAGKPAITGSADGTGANARFNGPTGVAVDRSGKVYVMDSLNATIRIVVPQ
jgi:sugar lactone lactonase YvrE